MPIDGKKLLREIKANLAALRGCPRHCFGTLGEYKFGDGSRRLTCENCGGEMPLRQIRTYQSGYAAAGGNKLDILISDLDE